MSCDPAIRNRRSIRLKGYDYTLEGAYFVTICTQNRKCLFGDIIDGEMHLNDAGKILQTTWDDLPNHYPHIELDESVIMPDHFHGIIWIMDGHPDVDGRVSNPPLRPPHDTNAIPNADGRRTHGLPEIIRALKTFSSRRINELRKSPGSKIWQRNYWDYIIRNDRDLERIRTYIQNNPSKWH